MKIYPDPILTASLFAAGHLDALFCQVIVPAALEVGLEPGGGAYLWLMRYGLRGDHWKIRFHGEQEEAEQLRAALERHAAGALADLPEGAGEGKKIVSQVPIDVEDEASDDGEDRARGLYTTHYRRSHVCLGTAVLHRQDAYCAAFTRALGHGSAALIAGVEPGAAGEWSHGARFSFLLKLLADGLAELRLGTEAERSYVAYHRDTLLRSTSDDADKAIMDGRALFDRRLEKMADGGARLVFFVRGRFDLVRGAAEESPPAGSWRGGLASGLADIEPLVSASASRIDTYAETPLFLPLFKIFQGMSNQIGLNVIEEAYIHHILLRALSAAESSP